jgi:hypothetical protein
MEAVRLIRNLRTRHAVVTGTNLPLGGCTPSNSVGLPQHLVNEIFEKSNSFSLRIHEGEWAHCSQEKSSDNEAR